MRKAKRNYARRVVLGRVKPGVKVTVTGLHDRDGHQRPIVIECIKTKVRLVAEVLK